MTVTDRDLEIGEALDALAVPELPRHFYVHLRAKIEQEDASLVSSNGRRVSSEPAFQPSPLGHGPWGLSLRSFHLRSRTRWGHRVRRLPSRFILVGVALSLSLIAAAVVLIERSGPADAALLKRALGAVGEGPVVHVVARLEPQDKAIDLVTGRTIHPFQIVEEWYEPGVGLRARLVRSNAYRPRPLPPIRDVPRNYVKILNSFTSGYTKRLQSTRANVAGHGSLAGRRVIWLRFTGNSRSVSGITISAEPTYEVAIDASTYRPVYLQELNDEGKPAVQTAMQLISVKRVAHIPPSAPPAPVADEGQIMAGIDNVGPLTPTQAASFMARRGLWLGTEYAGLPLARIEGQRYSYGPADQFSDIKDHWHGIQLIYGSVDQYGSPVDGKPWLELNEQTDPINGPGNPPLNGTLVMHDSFAGEAQVNDVYIQLSARAGSGPNPTLLIAAARSLEPIPRGGQADGSLQTIRRSPNR